MDALLVLEQNWPSEDRPSHGCPKHAETHIISGQTSVLYISVMWFEGRFLILCSAAGHSVWEMIDTNRSIFLCPQPALECVAFVQHAIDGTSAKC